MWLTNCELFLDLNIQKDPKKTGTISIFIYKIIKSRIGSWFKSLKFMTHYEPYVGAPMTCQLKSHSSDHWELGVVI